MKLKKFIYILLILALLPVCANAYEYHKLPENIRIRAVSLLDIDETGSTLMYERINISEDLNVWMLGWFWDDIKIVAGITDGGDIIYYNIARLDDGFLSPEKVNISKKDAYNVAEKFLKKIMPDVNLKFISSAASAYEYHFSEHHNSIRLLGRDATVVVDKYSGIVSYYKGFGRTGCNYDVMTGLVSKESALDIYCDKIGFELVYNTSFDHQARIKTIRPMYIANRKNPMAINAQTGEITDIVMYDYNYYYNDLYYDSRYYFDNNIKQEEFSFVADKSAEISSFDLSSLLNMQHLNLSSGYAASAVGGKAFFYANKDGKSDFIPAICIDIVPENYADGILRFTTMYDKQDIEWFEGIDCSTPYVFARAYVNAETGTLLSYNTILNSSYRPQSESVFSPDRAKDFISPLAFQFDLRYFGLSQISGDEYLSSFARYKDGVRIIGEGALVTYNTALSAVTGFSFVYSDEELVPPSVMKTPEEIKLLVKEELPLELFYVDKTKNTKTVVYDLADTSLAFDPISGDRVDLALSGADSRIISCSLGNTTYTVNGENRVAASPTLFRGKLYLPIEDVAFFLGYNIADENGITTLYNHLNFISYKQAAKKISLNEKMTSLDVPLQLINGKNYLSAGDLRRIFGVYLSWETNSNKIYIVK